MPLYIVAESGAVQLYSYVGNNPTGIRVWAKTELAARIRAPRMCWDKAFGERKSRAEEVSIPARAVEAASKVTAPRGELGRMAEQIAGICGALLDSAKGNKYVRVPRDTLVTLFQVSDELESKLDRKE